MSYGRSHCLEFHVIHDPETMTVQLAMVVLGEDGQKARYEGEGTYGCWEEEPHATLSVQSYPVESGLGDGFHHYVASTPTATSSCKVGELRVTKPLMRTFVEPEREGQKLIEEEERRG